MKKQYLITERAHFMCPNMHFGMLLEVDQKYENKKVQETLNRMAEAHPFLKCLIAYEDNTDKLYYKITERSQISLTVRANENTLWEDYKKISRQAWNVFENGLLKVYVYPKEQGMLVLFIAHHLLVDGRGLLDIAQEFANDYVGKTAPCYVEEQLIEHISELSAQGRLSGISKILVKQANKQWEKEKHIVSYEQYKNFVENYNKSHSVEYQSYEIDIENVEKMHNVCKENDFTMNDLLMAHMYVKTGTEKIIIAADVRDIFMKYRKGALGNYSTAMGIVCRTSTTDIIEKAKEVHKLVQKHKRKKKNLLLVLACYFEMKPTLLDAAAISTLGEFESKAGKFVGSNMFGFAHSTSYSITNLGKLENKNIKSMMFIPPASPAAKLTLGVVTLNGTMKVCSSRNEEN